ncbi:dihydroneopterin aldolase [Aestuariibacter sp. AA17]|uniref:7,8-dihydroneopterin aldolase n=1 Tax=Fluctibacter corallii TaxID=2984329 RepID=A0ABT3A3W6_9ALTE|nr:dihydroneopterin aldolase [Aestuariibacter sp. AA17]MCV2883343.1 dihydroneopterin aldolase [Aestuariibacter sp. AA17]
MDKIIIQGLKINALIGVYDWERESKQPLLVDIVMQLDLSKAAQSDDVNDTVDYAKAAELLEKVALDSDFQLLEALAGKLIDTLMATYPLLNVTLTLTKPNILDNAQKVAVQMTREA